MHHLVLFLIKKRKKLMQIINFTFVPSKVDALFLNSPFDVLSSSSMVGPLLQNYK